MGVFLLSYKLDRLKISLPHTRGGVSPALYRRFPFLLSSPHPWGCFYLRKSVQVFYSVFPTPVGVFLTAYFKQYRKARLPHTRGGVFEVAQADSANGVSSCTACRFSSRCSLPGFLPQHNSRPA